MHGPEISLQKASQRRKSFCTGPDNFPRFTSGFGFDAGKCVTVLGAIRPGDRITAKSKIHDIYTKTGRSGTMLFIVHRMEFQNQRGEPVSIVDWRMVQQDRGAR